ncbi:hypothetical protein L6164_016242 [Bauhinia variegata]|uniref:Uncharacterized protein n=1 Tax=Bauhinia variegata TaxID=167791 RepID=A0ACB9NNX8_BAUVA|nr:hypothetical protein L6164_016242 [Bauhinia variegata]
MDDGVKEENKMTGFCFKILKAGIRRSQEPSPPPSLATQISGDFGSKCFNRALETRGSFCAGRMETEDGASTADNTECPEGVQCLKIESTINGAQIADENAVAEGIQLKSEAVNNRVAVAREDDVTEGVQSDAVNNGVAISDVNDVGEGSSCGIRTYKRRKQVMLIPESNVQEDCRAYVEAASHLAEQAVKEPCNVNVGSTSYGQFCLPVIGSNEYSHGHWGNVILRHLYQSLGDDMGGIEACIRKALSYQPKTSCATAVKETHKIDKDRQECSSQLSHRLQTEANENKDDMPDRCFTESDGHGVTDICQHVLCYVFASEKFNLLCKVLNESFPGMKPEGVFDFSVINSRMKGKVYEQSPTLFLSDIQQVWKKLHDTGSEIVSLAKSLSNLSKTSYCEQAGVSTHSTREDEKLEFCNWECDSHMKPEQTEERSIYKLCTCSRCGGKADGTNCLVCDSCEQMYHISCIEPAVKEIPHRNWYCADCTASGIGSPHQNCAVCERLNAPKTLKNIVGHETFLTNEVLRELEDNSNCAYDGLQGSTVGKDLSVCKVCGTDVDGQNMKICGHPYCLKYYHVRCLTTMQLNSYGPRWYCPSCLCRVCLTDRDDDKIVLCDGCDHAYHIYCMKPPRTSIPKGKWYCRKCDAGIQAIRRAKKAYESNEQSKTGQGNIRPCGNLGKKWNNKHGRELDKGGGMEMLLTAASTLNNEENLAAIHIGSQ